MARDYQLDRSPMASASGIDYAACLNPEQLAAVTSPPGPALVIAGAGSGKTRTLTYRVAWLLDQGVDPRNILLLTFTNKAAREMTERVRELVERDLSELWSGTFHSIGNRLLRRHADELGFTRAFSILDRDDQKSLLNAVIKELGIDTKGKRFPKADVLASMFSLVENTGAPLEEIVHDRYDYLAAWLPQFQQIQRAYADKKRATNSMDFDDLLVMALRLMRDHPDLRALYQKRFQFVLVDEYQDTNRVQSELIDLVVGERRSLMVVGDDAQSIYSWRGADMEHILGFGERYPGAKVYKIETNYRSVPEILDLSNAAIRANRARIEKDLRSARDAAAMLPALVPVPDPRTQAAFVAQRLLELHDQGVPFEEMAVLYRAHFQSLEIQMELTQRGIPFQITSGLRFFEQAHIKDISAFLRFVTNRRDEVSFKRMVLLLPGVGPALADKLWDQWLATPEAAAAEPPRSFAVVLGRLKPPKKAEKHWQQLCHTLDELAPDGVFARPSDMLFSALEGVYDDYLRGSFDNYESRRQDIEQLMMYGQSFGDILEFLAQLSLMGAVDGEPTGRRDAQPQHAVTLSSIHQAKGLEWQAVFLIWLADGMFPNGRVVAEGGSAALEEERRLFYVALTRAKDELYLVYPQLNPRSFTGEIIQQPSRFLEDFPAELVEEWHLGGARPDADDEDPF